MALLLVIFHHMLKENEAVAFDTLNKIARASDSISMQVRYKEWMPIKNKNHLPDYILDNTELNEFTEIGDAKRMAFGLTLYAFWK